MVERSRFLSLVGLPTDAGLTDASVDPDAHAVSALDASGFRWPDRAVTALVYVFGDQDDAFAALRELNASADPAERTLGSVNGDLLLWLSAPADDPTANDFVDELASTFAGEE